MTALHWAQSAENGSEHDETSINLACIVVGINCQGVCEAEGQSG